MQLAQLSSPGGKCRILLNIIAITLFYSTCNFAYSQENNLTEGNKLSDPPYGLTAGEWNRLQNVWKNKAMPVTVVMNDKTSLTGQVIGLNQKYLTLWKNEKSFFNILESDSYLVEINLDTVRSVRPEKGPGLFRGGFILGSLAAAGGGVIFVAAAGGGWVSPALGLAATPIGSVIGAVIDRSRNQKLYLVSDQGYNINLSPVLKKRYIFYDQGVPSYIQMLAGNSTRVKGELPEIELDTLLKESDRAKKIFKNSKFSLAIRAALYSGFTEDRFSGSAFGISARVMITDWLGTGFDYGLNQGNRRTAVNRAYLQQVALCEEYDGLYNEAFHIHLSYYPVYPGRFPKGRFEVNAGTGISLNSITFKTDRTYITTEPYGSYERDETRSLGGILLSAGAGYFLTNKTALFISSEYNFVQSLYLPSETIFREHPQRIEIGTFDEIKIRPSSFDIMIGVRRNF